MYDRPARYSLWTRSTSTPTRTIIVQYIQVQVKARIVTDVLPLLVVLHIDHGGRKLPGRHLSMEQDVGLAIGSAAQLGQEEVREDPADGCGTAPDEAALAREVPAGGVEHLRGHCESRSVNY
jgi:hypothetical protein